MSERIEVIPCPRGVPVVSVIIPSLDGHRGGNVERLREDLRAQTVAEFEVIVPIGYRPNGHARNVGVERARGEYLVCIDDDVRLGHRRVLENLLRPFRDSAIGMTGPSQIIPADSNRFQRRAARQIPRSLSPIVTEITDSDMVTHMCLAVPTALYKGVGWESDTLIRGTDPDLRFRVRQAGYRVVVVPYTWAYHPMPADLRKLVRMAYRNGGGSAWVARHHPELYYEAPDGHAAEFAPIRSRGYRMTRFGVRMAAAAARGRWIRLAWDAAYAAGYVCELARPTQMPDAAAPPRRAVPAAGA